MRAILIDWMMEVCSEFHLKRETFHLAVAYLDRHLSKAETVPKLKLQLVGLTSMVIATKIEVGKTFIL
jgi:Cyclin, N-terminal domain